MRPPSPELRAQCAARLLAGAERAGQFKAFVGLDGFVDEILHVVDKRESAKKYVQARSEFELAFWMEMVLEGMHQALRLAREDLDSTITFQELMKFNVLRTVK